MQSIRVTEVGAVDHIECFWVKLNDGVVTNAEVFQQRGVNICRATFAARGSLNTKVHLLVDEAGLPIAFRITAEQAAEYAQAMSLREGRRAEAVIADKGYVFSPGI